jgi:hypothetical protein
MLQNLFTVSYFALNVAFAVFNSSLNHLQAKKMRGSINISVFPFVSCNPLKVTMSSKRRSLAEPLSIYIK